MFALFECFASLVGLAFIQELLDEEDEHIAVGGAHAHHGFVKIDVFGRHIAIFEAVHHIVVHLFAVDDQIGSAVGRPGMAEWREAIGQTFKHEVVAQAGIVAVGQVAPQCD